MTSMRVGSGVDKYAARLTARPQQLFQQRRAGHVIGLSLDTILGRNLLDKARRCLEVLLLTGYI